MKNNSLLGIVPVMFGFFVMGFCDIVGISSDYAQAAFGWSNTMTGLIPSMVFIWFLFLGVPTGALMNRWGRKRTVLAGMLLTIVGMVVPMLWYSSLTCMVAYAFLGIGNTVLQVSLNPLLQNVLTDQRMLTSSLTAGQVVKALSSLSGPWIMLLAVNVFGHGDAALWYYCFPLLGVVTLASALWLMLTPIRREEPADTSTSAVRETAALLGDGKILLAFFGIFFIVGMDVATNFISSKIMILRFDWSKEQAGLAPQIYFLARTAGAFIGAFLMTRIDGVRYFRSNILIVLAAIAALAAVSHPLIDLACIAAIGFFDSCVFSILFAVAVRRYPAKANLISGLMITAVAGGAAVPPLMGAAIDGFGVVGGLGVVMLCPLYLAYCAFTSRPAEQ